MKAGIEAVSLAQTLSWSRTADLFELTKPRITFLVVTTTLVGFYMGVSREFSTPLLLYSLLGTGLVAGGASAFNMYLECGRDALMRRTFHRPLPAGRLHKREAFVFALSISVSGMLLLWLLVNPLTSILSLITFVSYLFVYTPLKSRTWACTLAGAVPGALPPAMGWAAVTGSLSWGAWILFAIVFFWQLPHFYAIGWMHKEDYARAGFSMLSVVDRTGTRTGLQAVLFTASLVAATLIPSLLGISGVLYLSGAVVLGAFFLAYAISFARRRDHVSARKLFLYSVVYLPCLLTIMMIDKII